VSAGLPGLGLGGLFFIFSALLAPFRQLLRMLSGRSRVGDWAMIARQFAQATVMVATIDLSLRLAFLAIAAAGLGNVPSAVSATVIPLTLIGITSALLVGVLATAKFTEIAVRIRAAELPRVPAALPRATPLRTLALGSVATLAWAALLVAGASELSPLENSPAEGTTTEQRGHEEQGPKWSWARSEGRPQSEALSGPASASPKALDAGPPAAESGQEPNGSEAGAVLQPADSIPPRRAAPTHQETVATAPVGTPAAPPVSPGSEPPPVADTPHATGSPPESTGPPEGSPAPEHAGPPEGSPAPEHAGPPERSPPSQASAVP
jgi:hypothetical protein